MLRYMAFALLGLSGHGFAVELEAGVLYESGTEVEVSSLGIGITIPQGWQGGLPPDSAAFVLDNKQGDASIMMVFDEFDEAQLASMMGQNIPLDDGIYLMPSALPQDNDDYLENHYQVMGALIPLNAYITAKQVREGLSLATILMAADIDEKLQTVVVALTRDLREFEPVVAEPDPNATSWQEYLKGRYIVRYYTGSGYREKQELWLCSDGSFASSFNSGGYSMDGFSGAVGDNNSGRWQASGSINQQGALQLNYGNGKQGSHQLNLQDKLYLDGVEWLRGENERCY